MAKLIGFQPGGVPVQALALGAWGAAFRNPGDKGHVTLGRFTGTDDTIEKMVAYTKGKEGEQSYRVRQWAEAIVRQIAPKDYLSEILALRGWCTSPWIRYTNDARHVEQVKTPERSLLEVERHGYALLDCDDIACLIAAMGLQLGRRAAFCVVGFGMPGDYTHVFARIQEPRSGTWIVCDPVAGTREAEMLRNVTTSKVIDLD